MMLRTLRDPFNMEFFVLLVFTITLVDASVKEKPTQLLRTMATAGLIREHQLEDRESVPTCSCKDLGDRRGGNCKETSKHFAMTVGQSAKRFCYVDGQSGCNDKLEGTSWGQFDEYISAVACSNGKAFGCGTDQVALKSRHEKYVVAKDNTVNANSDQKGDQDLDRDHERFTVVSDFDFFNDMGSSKISLKSKYNGYLVAEPGPGFEISLDKAEDHAGNVFTVEKRAGGTFSLKTAHGRYVAAQSDGKLTQSKTPESFTVECLLAGTCMCSTLVSITYKEGERYKFDGHYNAGNCEYDGWIEGPKWWAGAGSTYGGNRDASMRDWNWMQEQSGIFFPKEENGCYVTKPSTCSDLHKNLAKGGYSPSQACKNRKIVEEMCQDGEQNQGEINIDCGGPCSACPCDPNPCNNGGTCEDTDADGKGECICAEEFIGATCDVPADRCNVYEGVENQVAVDEGEGLASTEVESLEVCKQSCTETIGCNSIAFCPRSPKSGCYLKKKILDGTAATAKNVHDCTTYYPKCDAVTCVTRHKSSPCYTINDRITCLSTTESRKWFIESLNVEIYGAECAWCPNGPCTTWPNSNNNCEPSNWLVANGVSERDFDTCLEA